MKKPSVFYRRFGFLFVFATVSAVAEEDSEEVRARFHRRSARACSAVVATVAVFLISALSAFSESAFAFSSLNPVFGMLLSLVLLYFFRRYEGKSLPNVLIKSVVLIAALLWATMLSVESGIPLVLMVSVLWFLRNRQNLRTLVGATASIAFMIFSPFFLAAPLGFMTVHFYNGDKGADNRLVNYLSYPVLLLLFALVSFFI